jgi:uncharacterized cupredoxin-like copper-binding protein
MSKLHAALAAAALAAFVQPALSHGDASHDNMAHSTSAEDKAFGRQGDPKKISRTINVDMSDAMRFTPAEITVKQGETIRFRVKNAGKTMHEMVLGTMQDLKAHADLMSRHPGMEHDEPNAKNTPSQTYGYGFCPGAVDKTHRDPMVYPSPCGGSRVARFGDPLYTGYGYPFGNATHDGARIHRWAMPIVANFYPPLNPHRPSKPRLVTH